MDSVARTAVERVEQAGIIFIDEIDKIAGREGGARPRRQPRRRAARHPADRRRHDRQHQVRHGADRSHPVHRRRRVSRLEAVGPDSRAAGPLSDPRRARGARHATSSSASSPSRAARSSSSTSALMDDRRASTLAFTDDAIERIADFATHRQRAHREHRRAPAAHRDGEAARRGLVRRAGPASTRTSRSTRRTSIAMLADIVKNEDCRGTFCDDGQLSSRDDSPVPRELAPRVCAARVCAAAAAARRARRWRRCTWCPARRGAVDRAPARRRRVYLQLTVPATNVERRRARTSSIASTSTP